jgi:hypothetical protein
MKAGRREGLDELIVAIMRRVGPLGQHLAGQHLMKRPPRFVHASIGMASHGSIFGAPDSRGAIVWPAVAAE